MSNKTKSTEENIEDKIKNRLTRSATQQNPDLKNKLVDSINSNIFSRSRKTIRSPPKQNKVDTQEDSTEIINTNCGTKPKVKSLNKNNLTLDIGNSDNFTRENKSDTKSSVKTYKSFTKYEPQITPKVNFPDDLDNIFSNTENNSFKQDVSLIDIEGITNQPSLIINSQERENRNIEISYFEHLFDNTMPENQPLKLSLKHVSNLVPEFDGKNISVNEYIEKLKHAKSIIAEIDEPNLIPILKIKLKGEIYKALLNARIGSINDFISAIRQLFPSTENIHSLYGKLTEILQKPDEAVLSFGNRIQELVLQIVDLKSLEANITQATKTAFETEIQRNALNSFKNGLKQEIRLELGEHKDLDAAIKKAITIEINLKKQQTLRNNSVSVMCGFRSENANSGNIYTCQICQDFNHEALFCNNAACVYYKN